MKILGRCELEYLANDLRACFPRSLHMTTMILKHLRGNGWPGTEFVCDDFPAYSTIMFRPIPDSTEFVPLYHSNVVVIFCKDPQKLPYFLDNDRPIDFSQAIKFWLVSKIDTFPVLLSYCQAVGLVENDEEHLNMIILDPHKLEDRKLPDGFRLGELNESHAEQINKESHYGSGETLSCIRQVLKSGSPSTAAFTNDGRLVAYILAKPDGSLGNGYVNPQFRRLGLFQIINYHQAKKVIASGQEKVWAGVMGWNEASRNAYLKMGADLIPDEIFCFGAIYYAPLKYNENHMYGSS